jgi:hypothetical protein
MNDISNVLNIDIGALVKLKEDTVEQQSFVKSNQIVLFMD